MRISYIIAFSTIIIVVIKEKKKNHHSSFFFFIKIRKGNLENLRREYKFIYLLTTPRSYSALNMNGPHA